MSTFSYNPSDPEFLVSRYIDGDLDEVNHRALETRLAEDASLQAVCDRFRALDQALRRSPPAPAVDWERFSREVERRCRQIDRQRARQWRLIGWTSSLAAAAAIGLLVTTAVVRQSMKAPFVRPLVVAEITVGPPAQRLAPATPGEFHFGHGARLSEPSQTLDEPQRRGGSIILASVSPLLSRSGNRGAAEAPF